MNSWLSVLSDLFVNISAAWFAVAFIEPQIPDSTNETMIPLILRIIAAIVSLLIAKKFREEAIKI